MSTILIVDDEKTIQDSLVLIFQSKGHQIDRAANGMEALSCLYDKKYDLVVTDIRMPRMDGIRLLEAIREQWGNSLPVILISAYVSSELTLLIKKAGAYEVVNKPFTVQTITQLVDTVLASKPEVSTITTSTEEQVDNAVQKTLLEFSALVRIQQSIRTLRENDQIFSLLLQQLHEIFVLNYAIIAMYTPEGEVHISKRQIRPHPTQPAMQYALLEESLLPSVSRSHRPLLIEKIEAHPSFHKHYEIGYGTLLAIPFKTDGILNGALMLFRQDTHTTFGVETIRFLTILMNYLSLKLESNERTHKLYTYFSDTVQSLFATLEAKDAYTYTHSAKVACYALLIAKQLDLPENEFRNLEYLALLHDIGKIALPEYLVKKREHFTEEEYLLWQTHPVIGATIIQPIQFMADGHLVVRHHHENYDGSGYPDGLKKEKIPLFARVIAIADGFANLTEQYDFQNRSVQKEMIERMMCEAGKKYDPEMLKLFLKAYRNIILLSKKQSASEPPDA